MLKEELMERGEDLPRTQELAWRATSQGPQEAMGAQTKTAVDEKVEQLEHPRLCPLWGEIDWLTFLGAREPKIKELATAEEIFAVSW